MNTSQEQQEQEQLKINHPGLKLNEKATLLLKTLAANALTFIANKSGTDLTNPASVEKKITDFNQTLQDPKVQEKVKKMLVNLAQNAAIIIKASEPAVIEFINTTGDVYKKTIPKIIDDFTTIGLNTLEAAPGIGILVGFLRDIDKGAQAFQSAWGAASEISTAATDAVNKTTRNLTNPISQPIKSPIKNTIRNSGFGLDNLGFQGGKTLKKAVKKQKKNKKTQRNTLQNIGLSIREFQETTTHPKKTKQKK
jgi:hypothetical protein